jgi:transposase
MDGYKRKKYCVVLTAEARERLEAITRKGSASAKKILHARVLLMSDEHHPAGRYPDAEIAKIQGIHPNTVARIRTRFVRQGEAPALDRKVRATPPTAPKLDGQAEAALVAICCSAAPEGQARWTLKLLVQEMVARRIVTSICRETIRTTLKKTSYSPGGNSGSAFPRRTRPGSSPRWSRCWTPTPGR